MARSPARLRAPPRQSSGCHAHGSRRHSRSARHQAATAPQSLATPRVLGSCQAVNAAPDHFFAPCPRGLEAVLARELMAIGAVGARETAGGVHFSGHYALAYRANLESRIASRIL